MLVFSNLSQTMRYSPWLSSSKFYLAPTQSSCQQWSRQLLWHFPLGSSSCLLLHTLTSLDLPPHTLTFIFFQLFNKGFPQLFASPHTALPSRALCFMLLLHPEDSLSFSPDPPALFSPWISWHTLYVCYIPAFVNNLTQCFLPKHSGTTWVPPAQTILLTANSSALCWGNPNPSPLLTDTPQCLTQTLLLEVKHSFPPKSSQPSENISISEYENKAIVQDQGTCECYLFCRLDKRV